MDLFLFADTNGSALNPPRSVSTARRASDPWCNVHWYLPNRIDRPYRFSPTSFSPLHQHNFVHVFSFERGPPHARPSPIH